MSNAEMQKKDKEAFERRELNERAGHIPPRAAAAGERRAELRPTNAPPVDVYESDDDITVVADMPGARPDSVNIKLEKDELFISANRDTDVGGQLLFGNRRDCEYRRTFLVPRGIDAAGITAEMTAGVLRVRMPKSAALKPRTITVNAKN